MYHGLSAVASCQEQKLLYQMIHVIGFMADRRDGLLQDLFILFAPTVQHIGISLDHCDGGAQLMGSIIDKTCLLPIGIPHTGQQIVHGRLYTG